MSIRQIIGAVHIWLLLISNSVAQDINYLGVAFQPYVKYGNPPYHTYLLEEIKTMLRLISNNNRHNVIATYSSGAAGNCIVARAAAEINKDHGSISITMAQGIYQNENDDIMNAEIYRALNQAVEANEIQPGTVWGLVFTNEYINNIDQGNRVLGMLREYKDMANLRNLLVGVRIHNCPQFYNNGNLKGVLTEIVNESDFIMCNIYPTKNVRNDVARGVKQVVDIYTQSANAIRQIKNIEVMIGKTGWASEGKTFFNDPPYNTVRNIQKFWEEMKRWAFGAKIKVHMFEAIDEPNKNIDKGEGERHFGWWYRAKDNSDYYIEKVTGRKSFKDLFLDFGLNQVQMV